jgi:predicted PurR-regulated permease PerM
LGGVSTLGVIGLFVGPLMMAILFGWLRDSTPVTPLIVDPAAADASGDASGHVQRIG